MNKTSQIKFIKAKVALLEAEKKKLSKKLSDVEKEPAGSLDVPSYNPWFDISLVPPENNVSIISSQQIELFRILFRGRDDVFARLWASKKTGKTGYSPVCKNEWVHRICNKMIIKCSECPN